MLKHRHLLCFGYGYTAQYLAAQLGEGWKISGTTRSLKSNTTPRVSLYYFDDFLVIPKDITHILISIPPNEEGDIVYNLYHSQLEMLPNLRWVGLLSTTGVYGDYAGDFVDEASPCITQNHRSLLRIKAEEQWLSFAEKTNNTSHIFRLSAIYGPYRNELIKVLKNPPPIIIKEKQCFSRVHVADIAQTLSAAMNSAVETNIFNVSDDFPCAHADVVGYAYRLLGKAPPVPINFENAELSEMMRSFYSESKKVKNDKIKRLLGIDLLFPSYKEGLSALMKEIGGAQL